MALVPIAATIFYYLLPDEWQAFWPIQFFPQVCAYVALSFWSRWNPTPLQRLGLSRDNLTQAVPVGVAVGVVLGLCNLGVILLLMPRLGFDYHFLADTPHARIPLWLMLPWFIAFIAFMVELNFRGFLLGRLETLGTPVAMAIPLSAVLFAFDPFMVATFRHLHWIAVWDGLIWASLQHRRRNLYIPIMAHSIEVVVLYSVMRRVLAANSPGTIW